MPPLKENQTVEARLDELKCFLADKGFVVDWEALEDGYRIHAYSCPYRQVAKELAQGNIAVRWSNTHGEQAHAKLLLVQSGNGRSTAILGSANFTRRNLNDLNLETDIAVRGPSSDRFFVDSAEYIDQLWNNSGGRKFSVDYQDYADESLLKVVLYRWMEATGMSTF